MNFVVLVFFLWGMQLYDSPVRNALMEEQTGLIEEIEFLRLCLEEEQENREMVLEEGRMVAPSINDLRSFEKSLEKILDESKDDGEGKEGMPGRSLPRLVISTSWQFLVVPFRISFQITVF